MKRFLVALAGALTLQLTAQVAGAVDGPDRPRTITKSNPGVPTHSKASSFAPRGHSGSRAYGAPVSKPILRHRKPATKAKAAPKPAVSG